MQKIQKLRSYVFETQGSRKHQSCKLMTNKSLGMLLSPSQTVRRCESIKIYVSLGSVMELFTFLYYYYHYYYSCQ